MPKTTVEFQAMLGDLAMAMAISAQDPEYPLAERPAEYSPGRLRDDWLKQVKDLRLRLRVVGLANAGMGSLQHMEHAALCSTAARYGIPIDAGLAEEIAEHFEARRSAVLRYNH
jgi:hypothetical protein